jgi:hypothetical protein
VRTIGLIACGKAKLDRPAPARELYVGNLFRACRAYVESTCDEWAILSAKHGLVLPDQVLAPYEQRLSGRAEDRLAWARRVNEAIRRRWCASGYVAGQPDEHGGRPVGWAPERLDVRFVVLAGADYRVCVEESRANAGWVLPVPCDTPLAGLQLGQQLAWLAGHLRALPTPEGAAVRPRETAGAGVALSRGEGGADLPPAHLQREAA